MRGRSIWSAGVWGGFVCALFGLSSLMHGAVAASAVMMAGAFLLLAWSLWLGHGRQ
jgi:hypothetical protein